jgi:flagellin-like hook-associated protein FlgL
MASSIAPGSSALAFIDTIIADMNRQLEQRGSHQKFERQLVFISQLRTQIEKNSVALADADFSEELMELRKLHITQSADVDAAPVTNNNTTQILSLFR